MGMSCTLCKRYQSESYANVSHHLDFTLTDALALFLVKIPQIIKVLRAESTRGLNVMSFYAELLAFTLNLAYNLEKGFPFRYLIFLSNA